jgi:ABC-type multidrug transport system permease subunit
MTFVFRTIAAATKRVSQALAISGVMLLGLVIYSRLRNHIQTLWRSKISAAGFVIPKSYMHPWFKWVMYINPIAYAFEGLMSNEVHGKDNSSSLPCFC